MSSLLSVATEFTSQLPGLVCTENDLAYLQRRKNVKQYEQLQVNVMLYIISGHYSRLGTIGERVLYKAVLV